MRPKSLLVLCALWLLISPIAAAVRADDLRYEFKPGERVFYEITVEGDASNVHRKITGYLVLQPTAVDSSTGDISMDCFYQPWTVTGQGFNGYENPSTILDTHISKMFESPVPADKCKHFVVDRNGKISKLQTNADLLAHLQGSAEAMVLQPLPAAGKSNWTTQRTVLVYRSFSPDGSGEPFRRSLISNGMKPAAADETVTYSQAAPAANLVTTQRTYDLVSQQKVGDNPVEHLHGDGHYVFDNQTHQLFSLEWNLTDDMTTKTGTISEPITVTARRLEGDDLTKARAAIDLVDDPINKQEANQPPLPKKM